MIDEIYDRHYQASRAQMNASLGTAFAQVAEAVGNSFKVLNRIEYSAPWNRPVGATARKARSR